MAQVSMVGNEQLRLFDTGVDMRKLREDREKLLRMRTAEGTRRAYGSDMKIFATWCESAGRTPIPATSDTVSFFLTNQIGDGRKLTTVRRRLAAIRAAHKQQGLPDPANQECRDILFNASRDKPERPRRKRALEISDLVKISLKLGMTNAGIRDRAILVFGLASGMRRSEIAALTLLDLRITKNAIVIDLSRSKTDQQGKGRTWAIFRGKRKSTDPVRTMNAWLAVRGKLEGPLFTRVYGAHVTMSPITGDTIHTIVQEAVKNIGLDPKYYGAHSLRAGLITAAAENGASDQEIMRASGHKTQAVMQGYVRYPRALAQRNVLAGAL